MAPPTVPVLWENRWAALQQQIDTLTNDPALKDDGLPRGQTLKRLIDSLGEFGQSHFKFFSGLFKDELNPSVNFPPEYVMRQVIARISEDAQVIQNCLEQRRQWKDANQQRAQEVLLTADRLAWGALRFAVERGLLPKETTAITYFQKSTTIRVVPYASVALIGIPITCLKNDIDFLAVPHEVGHYVYWNSGIFLPRRQPSVQAQLTEVMKGKSYWIQRWKQEIFADAYGALVAKAAIALSFQDLEHESSKIEIMLDDKKHPAPIVRPEIYAEAIRRVDAPLANDLLAQWNELLGDRQSFLRVDDRKQWAYLQVHNDADSTDVLLPNEIRDSYGNLLDEIDKILPAVLNNGREPDFPGRSETDLGKVYKTFSDKIPPFVAPIDAGKLDAPVSIQKWENWVTQFKLDAGNIPVEEWMPIFLAGGWTTEGPHSRDLVGG